MEYIFDSITVWAQTQILTISLPFLTLSSIYEGGFFPYQARLYSPCMYGGWDFKGSKLAQDFRELEYAEVGLLWWSSV